ncbi:MAG: serine/threonine protein kinase [Planctomycetota bacterium]|nr:MAG: serine/threonine protein kinase [Planctomycetota bacterium]
MFAKSWWGLLGLLLCGWGDLRAENWPAWRGPLANGECRETAVPLEWSPEKNVQWKVPLPEPGNSTPIIWGERIFVTQATDKGTKRSLICFHRSDGRQLWQKTIEYTPAEPTHATNPFCAASPVTDGERVVVSYGSAGIACYDLDGNLQWHRDLGPSHHIWGTAASPVIAGDLVFLNFGPGERTALYALRLKDGADAWKVEESGGKLGDKGASEWIGSWSTPIIRQIGGQPQLILSWPGAIKAYDPSTGRHLWSCQGLFKDDSQDKLVYTNPLATDQVIVAMCGFTGAWMGMRTPTETIPTGADLTESHRLWRHPRAPQRIGSGVIVGEHIYMVNEPGTAQCIEWKTGKILWTERVTGNTWASLVKVGDRLYTTSLEGETVVFSAQPKFEVLARSTIPERTLASLAISEGEVLIRTYQHLWSIREQPAP